MTELLAPDVIAERLANLQRMPNMQDAAAEKTNSRYGDAAKASRYRYLRPLTDAAETFIDTLENPGHNFMLGLGQIDVLTRGFRASELVMITGFSHGGKTQLILNAIAKNRDKRVLVASLDDPTEMLLAKLIGIHYGIPGDELERSLQSHDEATRQLVREAAAKDFANLEVIDDPLSLEELEAAIGEATDKWGAPPEAVVIDYLALMPTEGGYDAGDGYARTAANARSLKRWVKDKAFPVIVIHQGTRGAGGPGKPSTMLSGSYGGEQEATMLIGVRRKLFDESLDAWQRERERNTITVHVVKNKRPPNRRTSAEGIDFHLDESTGTIRRLRDDDLGAAPTQTDVPDWWDVPLFADSEVVV